jgi:hypothetical protein
LGGADSGYRFSLLRSISHELIEATLTPYFDLRFNFWFEAVFGSSDFMVTPVCELLLKGLIVDVEFGSSGHDGTGERIVDVWEVRELG